MGLRRPVLKWVRSVPMTFVGFSTLVAFHRSWSVSALLDTATWSSSSGFTSFYLRLRSRGPFVAAGSRIA